MTPGDCAGAVDAADLIDAEALRQAWADTIYVQQHAADGKSLRKLVPFVAVVDAEVPLRVACAVWVGSCRCGRCG